MSISRNDEQKLIMFSLYSVLVYQEHGIDYDLQTIIEGIFNDKFEDVSTFAKETVVLALKNQENIVAEVEVKLNKWKYERLNYVAQAIFLLALGEGKYISDKIDKPVVINVAVNLAKNYLDSEDYKFINAVLDKLL